MSLLTRLLVRLKWKHQVEIRESVYAFQQLSKAEVNKNKDLRSRVVDPDGAWRSLTAATLRRYVN